MQGWRRNRYADHKSFVMSTFQIPGSSVPPPKPHAEPEDYSEALTNFLQKVYKNGRERLEEYNKNLSDKCVKRLLWLCGGSHEFAQFFLSKQTENLAAYKCFIEYNDGKQPPTKRELERELSIYRKPETLFSAKPNNYQDEIAVPLSAFAYLGECPICLETLYAYENASLPCNHIVCFKCVGEYMTSLIKEGKTGEDQLCCPAGRKCRQPYNPYHVLEICGGNANDELFQKYIYFQVMKAFEASPFLVYCTNKGCNKMIISEPSRRRVVCRHCGTHSCGNCKKKYHDFPLCKRRDVGYDNSIKMRMYYIMNGTRPCPRCRFLIEKTRGCDHMTCIKCGYEFCWRCSKKYTPDHFNNMLNCAGSRGVSLEIWGPLIPIKVAYEGTKDVLKFACIGVICILATPYFCIEYRDNIKTFASNRYNGAVSVLNTIRGKKRTNPRRIEPGNHYLSGEFRPLRSIDYSRYS